MSDLAPEPSVAQLSASVAELKTGMKWFLGMFLLVVSVPNIFASMAIHRFQEIFQDALPGKPLPGITLMFVGHQLFFQFLTFAWPIAGLIYIVRSTRIRNWTITGVLLILAVGLQLMLTEYAMFSPMVEIDVGMSDQGGR
jgi:hypothetical protein